MNRILKDNIRRRFADQNFEISCLDIPVLQFDVIVRKGTLFECEGNGLLFAGLKRNLEEALQLLVWPRNAANDITDVKLYNFLARTIADICTLTVTATESVS